MGYRHANLNMPHIVIATQFPAVSISLTIPIMLPPVSINPGHLESALTQMGGAGTAGNRRELYDNYVANADWFDSNPFFV